VTGKIAALAFLLLLLVQALPVPARAQEEVKKHEWIDHLQGYRITLPEDYEITTNSSGESHMTINGRYIASLFSPWFVFRNLKSSPGEASRQLLSLLQSAKLKGAPVVTLSPLKEETRVAAILELEGLGDFQGLWCFRREGQRSYLISSFVSASLVSRYAADIETAFATCTLLRHIPFSLFEEPTEKAYKIKLPRTWKWEGSIYRDNLVPGFFVLRATALDGALGCFTAPPLHLPTMVSAETIANTAALEYLKRFIPDIRLESFTRYPRAEQEVRSTLKHLQANTVEITASRGTAVYFGVYKGNPTRLRLDIAVECCPMFFSTGGQVRMYGWWAPLVNYDNYSALSQSVLGSVMASRTWVETTNRYVNEAYSYRQQTFERVIAMREAAKVERYSDDFGNVVHIDTTSVENSRFIRDRDGTVYYYDQGDAEGVEAAKKNGQAELKPQ